ncbi:MAG: hypothetical protein OQL20_04310 [Sedimenticola sp.]|nr:hypothetical protein [Sedimenticola sp.]
MKKAPFYSLLVLLLSIFASSSVIADNHGQSDEERCKAYAKEDAVPADEMADFMKDCLDSIKSESEEKKDKDS